jgi:hypothetical protein
MKLSPALVAILFISMAIAAVAPFDVAFAAVTLGSPMMRVALICILTLIGAFSAEQTRFRLTGHGTRWPILIGLTMAVGVAVYVMVIDGLLFRGVLSSSYVHFFEATSLKERLIYFMLRAFNENVIYRLFVFSTLVLLISRVSGKGGVNLPPASIWCAMIAAQVLNIGMNVTAFSPEPFGAINLIYEVFRYVVPGVLWAWLYWRFGFLTAEVASVGCHLFLQPALGMLL